MISKNASTKTIKNVVSSMLKRAKMRMKASNSLGVRSHIAGAKHVPVDAMTSRDRHAARFLEYKSRHSKDYRKINRPETHFSQRK